MPPPWFPAKLKLEMWNQIWEWVQKKTKSKKHQSFTCLMSLKRFVSCPAKKTCGWLWVTSPQCDWKKSSHAPKSRKRWTKAITSNTLTPRKINCCAHNYSCPFVTYTACTNMYKPWHISSTLGPTPSANLRPHHHWVEHPEADARSRNLRGRESLVPCFGWEKSMGKYMSTWWFTPVRGKTYGKAYSCLVVHPSEL